MSYNPGLLPFEQVGKKTQILSPPPFFFFPQKNDFNNHSNS